jgi:ankyrin repeat protein
LFQKTPKSYDTQKLNLLHLAASKGRLNALKVLVQNGLKINAQSNGVTPLFLAVQE